MKIGIFFDSDQDISIMREYFSIHMQKTSSTPNSKTSSKKTESKSLSKEIFFSTEERP
jgi:hypothetical protein